MLASVKTGLKSSPSLYILVFALAVFPLVYITHTLDPVLAPRLSFLGLLIIFLSLLQFKKHLVSVPLVFPFLLLFMFIEAFSLVYAHSPSEVFSPLVRDSALAIFMLLVYQIAGEEQSKVLVAWALVVASISIGGYAIFQIISLKLWDNTERLYEISSFMGHRNLLSSALLLIVPWQVYHIYQSKTIWRIIGLLSLVSSLALIGYLESRTVWLALLTFGLSYLLSGPSSKLLCRFKPKLMLLLGMILVLIAFSSFVAIKLLHQDVPRKAQELETSVNLSAEAEKNFTVSERVLLWKASMNMIWDNDWAGVGAGNWKIFFPAYGSDIWRARQGMVQFQRPHNDFIWLIAELGILGLLSYLAIFTIILFAALRSIANPLLEQGDRVFIKLLFSGLIAYLVIAFFSFPRERIFHQVVLYLSFAFILRQQASEIVWRFKMIIFPFSAVITGLAAFSFGLNYWRSESTMLKVNQARAEGNWQELVLQHNKLADNYFYQIDAVSIPTSFYAGLAHLNLQNYPVSERYFEEAYALHPYNIHVINNLANIKLLSAKADTATYYYRKALAVSPKYLEGALNLMAAYFNTNQVKKAYSVLCEYERVFAVDNPNHPSLQTYRLMILRAMQDLTIKSGLDWIFLEDQELEKRHFKSLESGDVLFFK